MTKKMLLSTIGLVALLLVGACRPQPVAPRPVIEAVPFSPPHEKRRIVFEGGGDIYSMAGDGAGRRQLTAMPRTEYVPRWSPDGRRIAFLHVEEDSTSLWVMTAKGKYERKLADDVAEHYDWAPDSQSLVFTRSEFINYEKGADNATFIVPVDGSGERLVSDDERVGFDPMWAPDGSALAFTGITREDGEFNQDIFLLDPAGGELTRLTTAPGHDWQPRWSPDSQHIAFVSARHDPYDSEYGPYQSSLYVIDADGTNERRLTFGDRTKDAEHAWSPDGTRLVYVQGWDDDVAPTSATPSLWIVPLDGRRQPLARGGSLGEPEWSPTGAWVVYAMSEEGDDSEIMRLRPGGNEPIRLTDNNVHDSRPDW
jgi:TolB protein